MKLTVPTIGAGSRRALADTRALLTAGFSLALVAHSAFAAPAPLTGSGSGKCLDVNVGQNHAIQIYTCNGGTNQQWELNAAGELRTMGGARCLDAKGQGTATGTALTAYTCNGQDNQKWRRNNNGTIQGVQSNLCLDVSGNSTANQANVALWTCHGNPNQVWTGGGSSGNDTQSPSVPSNLRLDNLACRSATLSWSASTDNVGVAFYDIYHDGQAITTVGGGTLSTQITLTPGVRWGIYVNGRDAAGNVSQASTSYNVTVPQCTSDTEQPSTPSGLTGSVSGTSATLRWNTSTDNVGVAGYEIYRNDSRIGSTSGTTYTDSGLSANTAYRYQVAARDAQNNISGRSTSLRLTTGGSCSSAVCSVQQVTTDSDIPWGLITMPDGNIIYSRRDAQELVRLTPSGQKTVLGRVPNVQGTDGEGGLMGLAVSPNFPGSDPWIYILHTSPNDNRVIRIQYRNGAIDFGTHQVLLTGIGRNKFHNGGRLRYGPDGKIYIGNGDAQNGAWAQDTNNLSGKILRMNPDGSRPSDNPFGNFVWSYGHRNPQGLAFDSQGRLWQQEFGDTQDETNLIQRGGNYGWPNCEGTTSRSGGGCGTSGYIAPKRTYFNGDGSCSGAAIVRDVLYISCLRGERVYRHVISGTSLTNTQELFRGTYGRLRTVEPSIDGGLWLTTSTQGDKDNTANNSNERILKVTLGN
ncbi:MAG: PQQ-dependent sugar dehydrogenase [Cytophagales bacterium]|nr:PQQ-dependent sugar dehydrogenase [Rhizobacter sp.]